MYKYKNTHVRILCAANFHTQRMDNEQSLSLSQYLTPANWNIFGVRERVYACRLVHLLQGINPLLTPSETTSCTYIPPTLR